MDHATTKPQKGFGRYQGRATDVPGLLAPEDKERGTLR